GDIGNQPGAALLERHAHARIEARQDLAVRVGQDAAHQQGAGGGRQVDGGEVEVTLVGIAVLIGQPGVDRPLPPVRGAGDPARDLEQSRQVEIADAEVDVNRVDLVDLGQDRAVASRSDEIAGVHQPSIHSAVEWGGDHGVVQIELGQVSLGLGGAEVGRRGVPLVVPVFDVGPGGRAALDQVGVAGYLGFGL